MNKLKFEEIEKGVASFTQCAFRLIKKRLHLPFTQIYATQRNALVIELNFKWRGFFCKEIKIKKMQITLILFLNIFTCI